MPELIDAKNKINHWSRLISQTWDRTRSYSLNLRAFRPSLKIQYLQSPTVPPPLSSISGKTMTFVVGTHGTCIQFDWSHNVQTTGDHWHCPSPVTAIRKILSPSYFVTISQYLIGYKPRPTSLPPPCPAQCAKEQRNTPWHLHHWCVENNPHRWTPQRRRSWST